MSGFTLVELLIVVAIIGILVAIALPNFLAAQVRAKVARVQADFQAITTCLENYRIDHNDYPPNNSSKYNVLPVEITTPIPYITRSNLVDPFKVKDWDPVWGELGRQYTYTKIVTLEEAILLAQAGKTPCIEAIDTPGYNFGAFEKYGPWRLVSFGPDKVYSDFFRFFDDRPLYGSDVPYDPTNGTISWGNILRTQKSSEGRLES